MRDKSHKYIDLIEIKQQPEFVTPNIVLLEDVKEIRSGFVDFIKKELTIKENFTMQVFYSDCMDLWRNNTEASKYSFPIMAAAPNIFDIVGEWKLSQKCIEILKRNKLSIRVRQEDLVVNEKEYFLPVDFVLAKGDR